MAYFDWVSKFTLMDYNKLKMYFDGTDVIDVTYEIVTEPKLIEAPSEENEDGSI